MIGDDDRLKVMWGPNKSLWIRSHQSASMRVDVTMLRNRSLPKKYRYPPRMRTSWSPELMIIRKIRQTITTNRNDDKSYVAYDMMHPDSYSPFNFVTLFRRWQRSELTFCQMNSDKFTLSHKNRLGITKSLGGFYDVGFSKVTVSGAKCFR